MQSHARLLAAFLVGLLCSACPDKSYRTELESAQRINSLAGRFNAVLALDQRFPDTFEIKKQLGEMLMATEDLDKADSYLKRAEALLAQADSDQAKSALYADLALLELGKKKYAASIAYADKALNLTKDDPQGAVFLKARALHFSGKNGESFQLYSDNWPRRSRMSKLDMNIYFDQCRGAGDSLRSLEVLDTYQSRFAYAPGQGVQASQIYERLGRLDLALLSASMEIEYLHYMGAIDQAVVRARLEELAVRLHDKTFNPQGRGLDLLTGLRHHFAGEWETAREVFSSLALTHYYGVYLTLTAQMETSGATVSLLQRYAEVEPYFKSFPAYYYHFWRGMKKGQGAYTFETAREVLEKCVVLAPATGYARETRREIAGLLKLKPEDGDTLILPPQLDQIFVALHNGAAPGVLEPVTGMLALPENIYTGTGAAFLRTICQADQRVRAWLDDKKEAAAGLTRERLEKILGE